MSDNINVLREKLVWLLQFIDKTHTSVENITNSLLEAIQIPRDASWKDNHISQIIETTNQHRILLEEKQKLSNITILIDIQSFLDHLDEVFGDIYTGFKQTEKGLEQLKAEIESTKIRYKKALIEKNDDPWFYLCVLKRDITMYNNKKEQISYEIKMKFQHLDDKMDSLNQRFCKIFENYYKIEENYYERIYEIFSGIKKCDCQRQQKNDIFLETNVKGNINSNLNRLESIIELYDQYDKIGEEISMCFTPCMDKKGEKNNDYLSELTDVFPFLEIGEIKNSDMLKDVENIDLDLQPLKYGIYKFKKYKSSNWINSLVVFTKSRFIHIFDLNLIIKNAKNIKIKHSDIIHRLKQKEKKIGFFKKCRLEGLHLSEENELVNLTEDIMSNFEYVDGLIYSIHIEKEIPRLDKEGFEILIEFKGINSFSDLFFTKVIKIKAFILNDLYELFAAFEESESSIINVKNDNNNVLDVLETSYNEKPDKIESICDNTTWMKFEDTNPWAEQ